MQIQGTPLQEPQPYLENSIPMQEMYIQPNNQLLYAKPQDQNNNFPPPPLQGIIEKPNLVKNFSFFLNFHFLKFRQYV